MNEAVMYAKYNQAGNKAIFGLLDKLSSDEREKDRGSFYGSLSGLFRHVMGGTRFFLGMYKAALSGNAAALKAISAIETLPKFPEGALSETQWKELQSAATAIDAAYIAMAEALNESDLSLPVKIEWYGGNPASVPLSFMLSQLVVHNTHHRGQISQILDSLKIDNDYSGIDVSFV
ncbi:MAG: damage-inducible protein DinB [Treponema sp.]|nr:damage-inducible protein DinB [Treponema sp.]